MPRFVEFTTRAQRGIEGARDVRINPEYVSIILAGRDQHGRAVAGTCHVVLSNGICYLIDDDVATVANELETATVWQVVGEEGAGQ